MLLLSEWRVTEWCGERHEKNDGGSQCRFHPDPGRAFLSHLTGRYDIGGQGEAIASAGRNLDVHYCA